MFAPDAVTLHIFQNVHRDTANAPLIPEVSAWRKYILLTGLWSTAPAKRTRKMRRHAPAIRMRDAKAKIGPDHSLSVLVHECEHFLKHTGRHVYSCWDELPLSTRIDLISIS